jgi:DNA mismatch repair protein MutL
MSNIIQILSDAVANQIAAGEVVQRPASAVKELLENAIDSGATEIKLIIKDAGRTLIQLIDNGCGMNEIDARLCFERHATSKINKAEDLFAIRTFGFRGEALASIAAVAQVEMKTKKKADELGVLIINEGSEVKEHKATQAIAGTNIKVKNLFYNIPARRNFLKSNKIETKHILDEFFRVAIVNPSIAFEFIEDEKQRYKLDKSNLKQRIVHLFGDSYNKKLIKVEEATDRLKINGFIAKPEFAKKTRGEQYFFVNGRYIKHFYLNFAIKQAFEELVPENFHPSYFLFFEMDAANIDINIHPTKTEVKFTDEKYIYAILHSAVKKALSSNSITPSLDFQQESSFDYDADLHKDREIKLPTTNIDSDYNPFSNTKRKTATQDSWNKLYDGIEDSKQEHTQQQSMDIESTTETEEEIKEPTARAILQLHRKYILASVKSGLMIIDQEKAHERILYENFYQMQENATVHAQQLLFPQTIKLTASKYEMVMNYMEDIQSMGFDISDFGGNSIIVNAAPSDISSAEIIGVFEQIIDNLDFYSAKADMEKNKMLALSMAKSLSIKSGMLLEEQEMNIIIDKLFACKLNDISPDGKKIVEILPLNDINKYFK